MEHLPIDIMNVSAQAVSSVKSLAIQVCFNCEYVQVETNRYSSQGPICAECSERLETYKLIES